MMFNKIFSIFYLFIFLVTVLFSFGTVNAANIYTKTYGSISVVFTDALTEGAAKVPPSTTQTLNYSLSYETSARVCPARAVTRSVYYVLKHYSGSSYNYVKKGIGESFSYDFGSGNAGQQNKYIGVFYCDVQPLTSSDTGIVDTRLNLVRAANDPVWQSQVFDKSTASAAELKVQVVFSNQKPAIGSELNIAITNLGNVNVTKIEVNVNGKILTYTGVISKTIAVTEANGFKPNADNTVIVKVFENNREISTNGGTLAFSTAPVTPPPGEGGGGGGGGGTASGTSPTGDCTKADADANRCLYNPLPQSDLTRMFLTMARGFLTIIGIWGVMFLIVGGFKLITSAGNEEQLISAKKTITWAIIGVLIAIMSFSIIALVQNFLPVKEIKQVNTNGN